MVTVKGYVDRIAIVAKGQVVATHERPLAKPTMVLDPLHFLAALDRKPGALDHAPVFRDWKLLASFGAFCGELEGLHGALSGARRFVQVLQLLCAHPMARVTEAIEACRRDQLHSAEAVIQRKRSLAAIEATKRHKEVGSETAAAPQINVPLPDLALPLPGQALSSPCRAGRSVVQDSTPVKSAVLTDSLSLENSSFFLQSTYRQRWHSPPPERQVPCHEAPF